MKMVFVLVALAFSFSAFAADKCRSVAINAAEDDYGNDPVRTSLKVEQVGVKYKVTVGIGNAEDGAHDYEVVFPNGCDSKPVVTEIVPAD